MVVIYYLTASASSVVVENMFYNKRSNKEPYKLNHIGVVYENFELACLGNGLI